ncbi:MAG: TonB-dependent receptor [Bacteroidia bacterium]|nr:TonB-dependent receptor [Bacteroidia bacterium]
MTFLKISHIPFSRLFLLICCLLNQFVQAQISGILHGKLVAKTATSTLEAVPFASLYSLSQPARNTNSDSLGNFSLELVALFPQSVVVSAMGYQSDTFQLEDFSNKVWELKPGIQLQEVQINAGNATSRMSTLSTTGVETMNKGELLKAACCNLAESFGTNASIDVVFTDAISGAKKIQLLGLDGVYTLITAEGIPFLRGIVSSYGLGFVPGPWMENIQISKGAGTVATGYDALTGQLNLEFKKPDEAEKLFANFYIGELGRVEGNLYSAYKLKKGWSTISLLHGNGTFLKNDHNHDNFLDMPTGYQANLMHKWHYHSGKRVEGQIGFRGLLDDRMGGTAVPGSRHQGGQHLLADYQIQVNNRVGELFTKFGILFPEKPWKSIGTVSSWRYQQTNIQTNTKKLSGQQKTGYINLIYESIIRHAKHKFKTGLSLVVDQYLQQFNDSSFNRNELVPGLFAEYDFNKNGRFSFIAGYRIDFHNLYGTRISPRLHLKVNLWPESALRFSGGKGFRVANPFFEQAIMPSNRTVLVPEALKAESAWNYGVSFVSGFKLGGREGQIIGDYYRTDFEQRTIADFDQHPQQVILRNLQGQSFSNAAHVELSWEALKRLGIKLAYKYTDSRTTLAGKLQENPFTPRHKAMLNLAYATRFDKWKFDFTIQYIGSMRLPSTLSNPEEFQLPAYSKPFPQINAQITRGFKKWEIYVGGENLSNYKVSPVILSSDNTGSNYFDASMVYAPTMGINIYAGFRTKF